MIIAIGVVLVIAGCLKCLLGIIAVSFTYAYSKDKWFFKKYFDEKANNSLKKALNNKIKFGIDLGIGLTLIMFGLVLLYA